MFPLDEQTKRVVWVNQIFATTTSFNPKPYLITVTEGTSVGGGEPQYYHFLHTFFSRQESLVWETKEPELTIPDLADSIEAMLARREAGLSQPTTLLTMRAFPTDPSTRVTASDLLKDIQEKGKQELLQVNNQIAATQAAQAEAKAKAEAEAKAFANWKATTTG